MRDSELGVRFKITGKEARQRIEESAVAFRQRIEGLVNRVAEIKSRAKDGILSSTQQEKVRKLEKRIAFNRYQSQKADFLAAHVIEGETFTCGHDDLESLIPPRPENYYFGRRSMFDDEEPEDDE